MFFRFFYILSKLWFGKPVLPVWISGLTFKCAFYLIANHIVWMEGIDYVCFDWLCSVQSVPAINLGQLNIQDW